MLVGELWTFGQALSAVVLLKMGIGAIVASLLMLPICSSHLSSEYILNYHRGSRLLLRDSLPKSHVSPHTCHRS